ncbi:MAG: VOC family protein [Planctomycetes bacterium]|nr:VOC family protein [Planctomycetota bacterium]MCB9892694.1 VOC family protein [Planctomycetota bacterium]MCB9919101.1 VOC family protein [Planctomycetota bacterium]
MNTPPRGWTRFVSSIYYDDASEAIAWLCKAFGFEVRLKVEQDGRVAHSQLVFGDGMIMIGSAGGAPQRAERDGCVSPRSVDNKNTQRTCVFVDDADVHCRRARMHGATIASEPVTVDHGPEHWADRCYEAVDPEGHHWYFIQRVRG